MSEAKKAQQHTPGKWRTWPALSDGADHVRVCAGAETIAKVGSIDHPWIQTIADARLIAHAPELLEACRAVLDAIERADLGGEVLWINRGSAVHESATDRLQDVIEKATGQTPTDTQ